MAKSAIQESVNKQINLKIDALDIPYLVHREVHAAVSDNARSGCREAAKEMLNGATLSIEFKK